MRNLRHFCSINLDKLHIMPEMHFKESISYTLSIRHEGTNPSLSSHLYRRSLAWPLTDANSGFRLATPA